VGKANQNADGYLMKGWLSANGNSRDKSYIQIGNSLFHSRNFKSLSGGAQHLYLRMAVDAQGNRMIKFSRNDGKKYGIAPASCHRWIGELVNKGFISCIQRYNGGGASSVYQFEYG